MARYDAVFFDLFDTLIRLDRERMPSVEIRGKQIRSSAGQLHAVLVPHVAGLTVEHTYDALIGSWREAERIRAIEHREVAAPTRFADFFRRLALEPSGLPAGLTQTLLDTHKRALSSAVEFPARHRKLLERLARRHRLAVVSNFDYTPTALAILDAAGVRGLFATIVVSDEIGWRKPRADIFRETLRRVGVAPEGTLFVGDRADIDVVGAQQVGMHAAWINPEREPLPEGLGAPEYEIRDLVELEGILTGR